MSGPYDEIYARLSDPVQVQARQQRIAERAAARADPWRWYCRRCGATGESPSRLDRNTQAFGHTADGQPCGNGGTKAMDESGRFLHVWSYPGVISK